MLDLVIIKYDDHNEAHDLSRSSFLVAIGVDDVFNEPAVRHVRATKVMDGGMVEFRHIDSGELAGSMGIETFKRAIKTGEIGVVE